MSILCCIIFHYIIYFGEFSPLKLNIKNKVNGKTSCFKMRTNLKYNIGNGYGHFCIIDDFSVDISYHQTALGKNTLTIKHPTKTIENNSDDDDEVDTSKSEKC